METLNVNHIVAPEGQSGDHLSFLKVYRIHPVGTINICRNFCVNPSVEGWDISLDKTKPISVGGAKGKVGTSLFSGSCIFWGL